VSVSIFDGTALRSISGSAAPALRSGLPEFTLLPNPIFTRDNSPWLLSGNEILYWPCVVHLKKHYPASPYEFGLYYSTDHATGQGGIGLATAPHPEGPWTDRGARIYVDTAVGTQTETADVVWNPITQLFHMFYSQKNAGINQSTVLATSPNGVTNWTRVGVVIDVETPQRVPGNGHTGYARVQRQGKKWIAHHLCGGGNRAHFAVSYSDDGISWTMDRRVVPARVELSGDNAVRISGFQTVPFFWSGRQYAPYVESPLESGVLSDAKTIKLALYDGPNRLTPVGDLISPGAYPWCSVTTQMPHALEYQGAIYMPFLAKGSTQLNGCIGMMKAVA